MSNTAADIRPITITVVTFIMGMVTMSCGLARAAGTEHSTSLDRAVMETLEECRRISASCAATTKDAAGILVFPNVVKADFIVGGAGGKGALIQNGKIVGYYSIGAVSAGLQAGVQDANHVYVFRTQEALNELKNSPDWKIGADAGVTLISADANAEGTMGNILAYVFDAKGLHAGVALDVLDVWKTDSNYRRAQS